MRLASNLVALNVLLVGAAAICAQDRHSANVDLYGDPLPRGAMARLGTTRLRSGYRHGSPAISPDGELVACSGMGYDVFVWDSRTGKRLKRLKGNNHPINFVAFSPDGRSIVGVDWEGRFRCWNLRHGRTVKTMSFGGRLSSFELSKDGNSVLTYSDRGVLSVWRAENGVPTEVKWQRSVAAGRGAANFVHANKILVRHDHRLRLFDVETSKQIWEWSTGEKLNVAAVSPDGRLAAMAYDNNAVEVREIESDKIVFQNAMAHQRLAFVAFSPDGKELVTTDYDKGAIFFWDLVGREPPRELKFGYERVARVAFFPDGKRMMLTSARSTMMIVDAESGEEIPKLPGHYWAPDNVSYSPDSRSIVSFSHQGVIIWDPSNSRVRHQFAESISNVAFTPDGRRMGAGGYGGLRLCDLKADNSVLLVDIPALKTQGFERISVDSVAFSPDGERLVASVTTSRGERDPDTNLTISKSQIRIWDAERAELKQSVDGHAEHLTFLPNASHFVGVSTRLKRSADSRYWDRNGTIKLWDAKSLEVVLEIPCPTDTDTYDLAVSPDGRMIAVSQEEMPVRVYRVSSGEKLHEFLIQRPYRGQVRFTADVGFLIAGPYQIHAWNLDSGEQVMSLELNRESRERCFDISSDSKYLVTGHSDGSVKVRSFPSGDLITTLSGHEGEVKAIAFAPDGKSFTSMSADCTGLVWKVDPMLWNTPPDEKELLANLWDTLAVRDASTAYKAVEKLVAIESAAEFLGHQVRHSRDQNQKAVAEQIKRLSANNPNTREQAAAELVEIGSVAERPLREKLPEAPPETRRLIETLLDGFNTPVIQSSIDLQVHRAILGLEKIGTPDAVDVLKELAGDQSCARVSKDAIAAVDRLRRTLDATKSEGATK